MLTCFLSWRFWHTTMFWPLCTWGWLACDGFLVSLSRALRNLEAEGQSIAAEQQFVPQTMPWAWKSNVSLKCYCAALFASCIIFCCLSLVAGCLLDLYWADPMPKHCLQDIFEDIYMFKILPWVETSYMGYVSCRIIALSACQVHAVCATSRPGTIGHRYEIRHSHGPIRAFHTY